MAERIAPIRASVFLVLVACGALCQTKRPAVGLLEAGDSNSPKVQIQGKDTWMSFPDAPSILLPTRADRFHAFVVEARSTRTRAMVGINPLMMRETDLDHVTSRPQYSFSTSYKKVSSGYGPSTFLGRYLYPSLLRQNLRYRPSTSSGFLGRASYAASRIFVTRDDSGKGRLNSSYFLGALTSVAIHTAYRPYWTRSPSAAFNNLGSTIGSDAGINLFREFAPGIRQMVRDHPAKRDPGPAGPNTHDQKSGQIVCPTVR
jgi:hypothetical protein